MATWNDVRSYVISNYEVEDDRGDGLTVMLNFSDGTSQKVEVVDRGEIHGERWVGLMSGLALESQVNLRDVLLTSGDIKVGGLGLLPNGLVFLQHAVPLSNLDENGLGIQIEMLGELGEYLKGQLTGRAVS
jgi:hypothetical protein